MKRRVLFKFTPPFQAQKVTLAGTFNGWNKEATPICDPDSDGVWEVIIILEEETYQYKFVVNGSQWFYDPDSDDHAPDGFGGMNSVIHVDDRFEKVTLKRGDVF